MATADKTISCSHCGVNLSQYPGGSGVKITFENGADGRGNYGRNLCPEHLRQLKDLLDTFLKHKEDDEAKMMKEYPVFLEDGMTWGYTEIRCTAGEPLEIVEEEYTVRQQPLRPGADMRSDTQR